MDNIKRNIIDIIVIEIINNIIHIVAFHLTTFTPSRGPNGNKLNVAKTIFIKHINPIICPIVDVSKKT